MRRGLADVKLGSQTKLASYPEEAGSPAIKAHMGGHEMQHQHKSGHKSGQLAGAGSGLQTPAALAGTLSGHRRTSTWTPGTAATDGTNAPGGFCMPCMEQYAAVSPGAALAAHCHLRHTYHHNELALHSAF